MGKLTEVEIFDCMRSNLRAAASLCEDLARSPVRGPNYSKLRDALKLIEGCCRQASAWREDTRWLNIGMVIAEAHKRAGGWLRGQKIDGVKIKTAESVMQPLFRMLAENLRAIEKLTEQTKTGRTGRVGMILPEMLAPPIRTQGRAVTVQLPNGMKKTASGLILPASLAGGASG